MVKKSSIHSFGSILILGLLLGITGCNEITDPGSELDFEKIIFVKRATYVSDHFYTDFINGCSPSHLNANNGIYTVNVNTGVDLPIITSKDMPGGKGIFGRYSLSFDAAKLVFDYKENLDKGFRIWEVGVDGTGLQQLTFEPSDEAERMVRYSMQALFNEEEEEEENEGPTGACCFADDSFCEQLIQTDCEEEGGAFHADTTCASACPQFDTDENDGEEEEEENEGPTGACCFADDSFCEQLIQTDCEEEGGAFHADTTCASACPQFDTDENDGEEEEEEEELEALPSYFAYRHQTDDMHPTYAPDGSILFTSTRAQYITLCNSEGSLTTPVLHRMDADGSNIEQLTRSPVSEFGPVAMPDGRILYTRWEYIDKGSVCVKGLWSMNPDGSASAEVFGNNHSLPTTVIHGRTVPGDEHLVVAVGCPHFPQGGSIGSLILIDTSKDIRTSESFKYLTPDVTMTQEGGWSFNGTDASAGNSGHLYTDPYPLRKDLFLVSCKTAKKALWNAPAAYDLYFLDDKGNRRLIKNDALLSLWQPVPLRTRTTPTSISSVRRPDLKEDNQALLIVSNVYEGMEDVQPGTIKWLRINEAVPRFWSSQRWQYGKFLWDPYFTSTEWVGALWVRAQWGIVPVESDGSACFTVPADRNIFLQALDENYMEVQRERTYVNYRPGEIRSCVGCHEQTGSSAQPIDNGTLLALTREPSTPGPQPGETTGMRVLHYESDIQPIFDEKCVSCHGETTPRAGLNLSKNSSPDEEELYELLSPEYFFASYNALLQDTFSKEDLLAESYLGPIIGENWQEMQWAEYLPPYSLGSHKSTLVKKLKEDATHSALLSNEELIRIITFIDSNAQYYGTYYGRHHSAHKDHPNFRVVPTFDEAISSEAPIWHQ